jgi:hypothetical protein
MPSVPLKFDSTRNYSAPPTPLPSCRATHRDRAVKDFRHPFRALIFIDPVPNYVPGFRDAPARASQVHQRERHLFWWNALLRPEFH